MHASSAPTAASSATSTAASPATTAPAPATPSAPAAAVSGPATTAGLGHVALDVAAAHVGAAHGGDGRLCLVSRGEGDEGKTFPCVVGVRDRPVLTKGFFQIVVSRLLADIVNKDLCTFNLFSPAASATATAATSPILEHE